MILLENSNDEPGRANFEEEETVQFNRGVNVHQIPRMSNYAPFYLDYLEEEMQLKPPSTPLKTGVSLLGKTSMSRRGRLSQITNNTNNINKLNISLDSNQIQYPLISHRLSQLEKSDFSTLQPLSCRTSLDHRIPTKGEENNNIKKKTQMFLHQRRYSRQDYSSRPDTSGEKTRVQALLYQADNFKKNEPIPVTMDDIKTNFAVKYYKEYEKERKKFATINVEDNIIEENEGKEGKLSEIMKNSIKHERKFQKYYHNNESFESECNTVNEKESGPFEIVQEVNRAEYGLSREKNEEEDDNQEKLVGSEEILSKIEENSEIISQEKDPSYTQNIRQSLINVETRKISLNQKREQKESINQKICKLKSRPMEDKNMENMQVINDNGRMLLELKKELNSLEEVYERRLNLQNLQFYIQQIQASKKDISDIKFEIKKLKSSIDKSVDFEDYYNKIFSNINTISFQLIRQQQKNIELQKRVQQQNKELLEIQYRFDGVNHHHNREKHQLNFFAIKSGIKDPEKEMEQVVRQIQYLDLQDNLENHFQQLCIISHRNQSKIHSSSFEIQKLTENIRSIEQKIICLQQQIHNIQGQIQLILGEGEESNLKEQKEGRKEEEEEEEEKEEGIQSSFTQNQFEDSYVESESLSKIIGKSVNQEIYDQRLIQHEFDSSCSYSNDFQSYESSFSRLRTIDIKFNN